ncbi:MAG: cytochrome-c peroxidase, partial [Bacteroidota bacterium]
MRSKGIILSLLVLVGLAQVGFDPEPEALMVVPKGWPAPHYDLSRNPLSGSRIALGRQLFYDPILSADNSVSCANCHLSYTAFTHVDHALSHGIGDSIGTRNSLALMNLAWSSSFMWDGAINHLDMQALAPIAHPAEMGSDIAEVVSKLNASAAYRQRFQQAYGDSVATGERVLKALAQFELTLVSANAKYDQVMRQEAVFDAQEQRGYALFQIHCNSCHREPLFTTG